jgi:hypothetical protein
MSHSLARKLDKIVSKLANKHNKETKSDENNQNDNHSCQDTISSCNDNHGHTQHESILQRMKGHLGHTLLKTEHSNQRAEGVPPYHVVLEELRQSPFQGKNKTYQQ